MTYPDWLSEPETKWYAIPKEALAEGRIDGGRDRFVRAIKLFPGVYIDAWREAWGRCKHEQGQKQYRQLESGCASLEDATPPDGPVWLIRRVCEHFSLDDENEYGDQCRGGKLVHPFSNGEQPLYKECPECIDGHSYRLVRADAVPVSYEALSVLTDTPNLFIHAGLRAVRGERMCDHPGLLAMDEPHGLGALAVKNSCPTCNGTGTIPGGETFDVWRDEGVDIEEQTEVALDHGLIDFDKEQDDE